MKPYRAVVFDFDMTLADSSKIIVELLNQVAQEYGFPARTYEETLPVVGNTHEIMLSYVTGVTDPAKILEMRSRYRDLCRSEMPKRTQLYPGAVECLRELYGRGLKVGLLSLKLREVSTKTLVQYDVRKYFAVVLGCEEVPAPKPDPSGLFAAMEQMRVSAEETLYIGDSLVDQETARGAGVDFSAMLLGGTREEQFDANFCRKFYHSLVELRQDICE